MRRLKKKPTGPAETLELEITDLSAAGAGVARDAGGRVIFVPFTMPGDRVRAAVRDVSKRYANAVLLEVLTPSPRRETPRCPVFGRCGGCQWQHVPYELQFQTKARGLLHSLRRREIEPGFALEELPAERIWEYRNRVQLRGAGTTLGFYAAGSHEVVPIERCDIARPEINAAFSQARAEGAGRGTYKLELDVSENGELRWAWNLGHSALGFRQVHDEQNAKLRDWVASAITPGRVLFDLFGGNGNLSGPLVGKMTEIHCVDVGAPVSDLTQDSTKSSQPSFNELRFHREPVVAWLARATKMTRASTQSTPGVSAILDPPREGLAGDFDVIEHSLRALSVVEIVAVGCDADAWAQDISRFLKRGWKLTRAAALDLFPQTPHVEGIALLRL